MNHGQRDKRTLSDEHLQQIGFVVTEWARAERSIFLSITQIISRFPNKNQNARVGAITLITAGMDPRTAMGIISGIIESWGLGAEKIKEFAKIKQNFEKLYKSRNTIAHSVWEDGERPNSISSKTIKTVGKLDLITNEYTAKELNDTALRIQEFRMRLFTFLHSNGIIVEQFESEKEQGATD